jgi:hypothetical protein
MNSRKSESLAGLFVSILQEPTAGMRFADYSWFQAGRPAGRSIFAVSGLSNGYISPIETWAHGQ